MTFCIREMASYSNANVGCLATVLYVARQHKPHKVERGEVIMGYSSRLLEVTFHKYVTFPKGPA